MNNFSRVLSNDMDLSDMLSSSMKLGGERRGSWASTASQQRRGSATSQQYSQQALFLPDIEMAGSLNGSHRSKSPFGSRSPRQTALPRAGSFNDDPFSLSRQGSDYGTSFLGVPPTRSPLSTSQRRRSSVESFNNSEAALFLSVDRGQMTHQPLPHHHHHHQQTERRNSDTITGVEHHQQQHQQEFHHHAQGFRQSQPEQPQSQPQPQPQPLGESGRHRRQRKSHHHRRDPPIEDSSGSLNVGSRRNPPPLPAKSKKKARTEQPSSAAVGWQFPQVQNQQQQNRNFLLLDQMAVSMVQSSLGQSPSLADIMEKDVDQLAHAVTLNVRENPTFGAWAKAVGAEMFNSAVRGSVWKAWGVAAKTAFSSRPPTERNHSQQTSAPSQSHPSASVPGLTVTPTQPGILNAGAAAAGSAAGLATTNVADASGQVAATVNPAYIALPEATRRKSCFVCLMQFDRKEMLSEHALTVHNEPRPFPCLFCFKRFTRNTNLLRHERERHAGTRREMNKKTTK